MKANTIAALVATLIASVSAAPTVDTRDLPLLGGNSGLIGGTGPVLNGVESAIPGLGGTGSGQGDAGGSLLGGGLGGAGVGKPALPVGGV